MPGEDRRYDVVVYGATSFVGRILCHHLVGRHGVDGALRWAIAGRSASRLAEVADATGAHVDRLVADATDRAALDDLVGATRVVVSTVGPYALHGSDLVAAAVAAGTDYCDLTGEAQWMRRMIDAHHAAAEVSGARIVHACGFDSVPSDLGVWHLQRRAVEQLGEPCDEVRMRVHRVRGGASGGTIASVTNLVGEAVGDAEVRRMLTDPYCLNPPGHRSGPRQRDTTVPRRDPDTGEWLAPFVMAAVNTRVVQRTHALLGRPWGPGFRYDEALATGTGPVGAARAAAVAGGTGAGLAALAFPPTRRLAGRFLPAPGEGPSEEQQLAGSFELRFRGTARSGGEIRTRVVGDRDPGYGATARMLGEAAGTLLDVGRDEVGGGFWTPASALDGRYLDRLEAHAGMHFEVLEARPAPGRA